MTPSERKKDAEAYVWVWLPGEAQPVVAGKLTLEGKRLLFNYGQSYLGRENRISLYERELPLQSGVIEPLGSLLMPGCIRDGSPDAWGRRVIINSLYGARSKKIDDVELGELTYLLESGSDRIGALDFQRSATHYEPRAAQNVDYRELLEAAERVENGVPLTPELDRALHHGTPIGGARPWRGRFPRVPVSPVWRGPGPPRAFGLLS
jgi:serine/threonine-protein kinase HipA